MEFRKIAVAGYFGCGNFGDDWLLEATLAQLAQQGVPREQIVCWHRARPKLRSLGRVKTVYFLGGLLQDATSFHSFFYYWCVIRFLLFLNKRVIFYSASIGPLQRPFSRWLLRQLLSSRYSQNLKFEVRDSQSAQLLRDLGFSGQLIVKPDVTLFDTFFVIASPPLSGGRGNLIKDSFLDEIVPPLDANGGTPLRYASSRTLRNDKENSGKTVGIILNGTMRDFKLFDLLADYVKRALKESKVTFFMAHPKRDYWQYKKLSKTLGISSKVTAYRGNRQEFVDSLSLMSEILTLRLHGAIAAQRLGIPLSTLDYPVAAYYSKVAGSLNLTLDKLVFK